MPLSGNTFTRLYSWVADAAAGIKIRADRMDADANDIADGITQVAGSVDGVSTGLAAQNGSALLGFIQTFLGALIRTVQDKLRDDLSVCDFGADSKGIASSVAAFQAAVNSFANGAICVITVPRGTYLGDMTTLTFGTRQVVWKEQGGVTYTTARPKGQCVNALLGNTNNTRPWFIGNWGFADEVGRSTGTTSDQPRIYATRVADHTGGPLGSNPSAVSIQSTISGGVTNYESGLVVQMDSSATGNNTNQPNFVSAMIVGRRKVAHSTGIARTYGANIVVDDQTTRGAITGVNAGGLIALELDVRASGPDTMAVRHGLLIVPQGSGGSSDGSDAMTSGVCVRPSTSGTINTGSAYRIDAPGGTSTYDYGIFAIAPFNVNLIDMVNATATGVVRFGMSLNTPGAAAQLQMVGLSSTGNQRLYGEITTSIITNTNGAEVGALALQAIVGGTLAVGARVANGVTIGAPTGGFKGDGTLNVGVDIYKNNTAYNNPDYVFEHAYTGQIVQFADNPGASTYGGLPTIDEAERITRETLKLPGMTDEIAGSFERHDKALEQIESLALWIFELNRRVKSLEACNQGMRVEEGGA